MKSSVLDFHRFYYADYYGFVNHPHGIYGYFRHPEHYFPNKRISGKI